MPAHEAPSDDRPFLLITGRTLYQVHTRTKTGRTPQLNRAAPEVWVEIFSTDAQAHGIGAGDLVEVCSPRGAVRARTRISQICDSVLTLRQLRRANAMLKIISPQTLTS